MPQRAEETPISPLDIRILPQPDDTTCGPTCLHSLYRYYGERVPLEQVIAETAALEEGGTLAVFLALHALKRGYRATIYSFNLQVFDPTWAALDAERISAKLTLQREAKKKNTKLARATGAYLEFLELGGRLKFESLTPSLIRHYLRRGTPILTGLSATYLYQSPRERPGDHQYDDVAGLPSGHFVILAGYDMVEKRVLLADPLKPNPLSEGQLYEVRIDQLICAILLGIVTYDANLLIIEPKRPARKENHADPDRS
ncbi:MAG: hypothetical protein HY804_06540 [Nitrospinae bacterium]|nr:hypothetical protein [Nitrospinota bacterium]